MTDLVGYLTFSAIFLSWRLYLLSFQTMGGLRAIIRISAGLFPSP
ncbi:hypothetical protein ECTW09195_3765 [Escherichia coli TW09195]|uniref:Uncharacterized protein n=1 Tax=Escherichia coli (strain SE11) TaxID=409438 RepID=A0A979H2T2_ECOSE|nr:hypothetical protein HMPREF9346_00609 [Escherichia coli MS 119-7]EFK50748.1 hypothetical protein HMPREF9345_02769 [Escherichia coli MS 107-1]EFO59139.1 hypothetical protein HMPREF9348_01610 [Escherichia coli MS 145-7]EGU99227.1 hypothetical protein HMPREF9349_00915 [Escherichia coli MS 79-10]EHV20362.1 hypothetical protein ECDEC4F_3383 [Escherichia coli DEC4F]EHV29192.1 hypothetical protein ECDEC5B_3315 [Escherichia coli DEC5B]EHY07431.1 hypothetical protein ECDEC15C_2908 [Escherichia coli